MLLFSYLGSLKVTVEIKDVLEEASWDMLKQCCCTEIIVDISFVFHLGECLVVFFFFVLVAGKIKFCFKLCS